jgi:2'-hydroxyisoflavone reductase
MKILVTGERSFASQGLIDLLQTKGHEVTSFSRGRVGRDGNAVRGPVEHMDENPCLQEKFDAVVNYIFLAGEPIQPNIEYIESLLRFCRSASVRHLIHISSVSAYKSTLRLLDEEAPIESDPTRKGVYGSLKAATDQYIQDHAPSGVKVSMVRPAFILAPGLKSPIAGNGVRLPWGKLLTIGNPNSQFPLISRDILNQALLRIVESPPPGEYENLLIASPDSPTRRVYLEACCTELGTGKGVTAFPGIAWLGVVLMGRLAERVLKLPAPKLLNRVPKMRIRTAATERRLDMDLRFDWRAALRDAVGNQERNFELPYLPLAELPTYSDRAVESVTFLGFGRIARTRHIPALEALQVGAEVAAYDAYPAVDTGGVVVKPISEALPPHSDLYIVASPGPAHAEAIPLLTPTRGPVLVEKPLAYSQDEFDAWKQFAANRQTSVAVCHNYRVKHNVAEMLSLMQRYNPGKIQQVHVHFESAPVSNDVAMWMRDERRARTLLMDYAINLLDVACMFDQSQWTASGVRYALDARGHTSEIEGALESRNYGVTFLLRQGFGIRVARILFTFQNYDVSLGFFPDTCVAYMANDNPWIHLQEAGASTTSTYRKVLDRLTGGQSDESHAMVIGAMLNNTATQSTDITSCLGVDQLEGFYRGMFQVSEAVYGSAAGSPVASEHR